MKSFLSKKLIVGLFILFFVVLGIHVIAGDDLTKDTVPAPTMYTLTDIYNLIHNNDEAGSHNLYPTTPTTATSSYSVSQIYADLANLIKRENVATGTEYLGVTGAYGTEDPAYATTTIFFSSSLTATSTPGTSLGYSLEDIWNLIQNSTTTPGEHDATPAGTPASSMHSLSDIYTALVDLGVEKAPFVDPDVTYLGEVGTFCYTNPVTHFAAGDGSPGDPYQICNWTQLNYVRNDLTINYKLVADISDATSDYTGLGDNWTPIGPGYFSGDFDGNNKTISDLIIDLAATTDVGLFAKISGAVADLGLISVDVTGNIHVGGLVGEVSSAGLISNCYSSGTVSGVGMVGGLVGWNYGGVSGSYSAGEVSASGYEVGGLIGRMGGGSASVSDSYSESNVNGGDEAGGFVGQVDSDAAITNSYATGDVTGLSWGNGGFAGTLNVGSTISDSYSTGTVIGSNYSTGGFVGELYGTISNVYSNSNVTGAARTGGLVGTQYSEEVTDSYATGDVTGGNATGGLIGSQAWGVTVSTSYSTGDVDGNNNTGGLVGGGDGSISNCYATGNVVGGDNVGGLTGYKDEGVISSSYSVGEVTGSSDAGGLIGFALRVPVATDSYWDIETSGQGASAGGIGTTTVAMQTQSTFVGWDFGSIWEINEGAGYPTLQ